MEEKCVDCSGRANYGHKKDYTRHVPTVYFYYIDNEIVYVGKTINGVNKRLNEHYHQNDELSKHLCDVHRIDYMQLSSQADMDMCELFYIYKLRPKFNKTIKSYTEMSKKLYDSLSDIFTFNKSKTLYNMGTKFFDGENKEKELETALKERRYSTLILIAEDLCKWGNYDIQKIKELANSLGPTISKYRTEFKTRDIINFICKNIDKIKNDTLYLSEDDVLFSTV